jgi:hypothetical protein
MNFWLRVVQATFIENNDYRHVIIFLQECLVTKVIMTSSRKGVRDLESLFSAISKKKLLVANPVDFRKYRI